MLDFNILGHRMFGQLHYLVSGFAVRVSFTLIGGKAVQSCAPWSCLDTLIVGLGQVILVFGLGWS